MRMDNRSLALWGFYAAFVVWVMYAYWHETIFRFSVPMGGVKLLVWLALAGFLAYSIYCSLRESLFRTISVMAKLYWGRQIGIDLYLGLFIGMLIIYFHEGPVAVLVWLIPTLLFANLSMLLYVAVNFDSLAARLLGA